MNTNRTRSDLPALTPGRLFSLLLCLSVLALPLLIGGKKDRPLSFQESTGEKAEKKTTVESGDPAPGFRSNDHRGRLWSLSEHAGDHPVVLYFYPAAMTSGCTKQACSFRDRMAPLNDLDATVVGISADPVRNLRLFRKAHNLNFTLLSDPDGSVARKYGVPMREGGQIERTLGGTKHTLRRGATFERWTFVIDRRGNVVYRNTDVNPVEDSKNVIEVLKNLE